MHEEHARRPGEAGVSALRTARDLPHSLEAEQAVLGAILTDETAFDQVAALIRSGDFYLLAHQHVYGACEELAREAKTLDPILVQQRLDAKGLLGTAVPHELPLSLGRAIGSAANVAHYARVVQEQSSARRMMLAAQRIVEMGYEAGTDVQRYLDASQQQVLDSAQGASVDTLKRISEPALRALEGIEAVQKRVAQGLSPITGVPTGINSFDKNTLGLQPGTLTVLAARPSVGKTAFALNIAVHAATCKEPRKVAFFSLEMPSEQLALRILASEAKLDWRKLSQGKLGRNDWDKLANQADRIGAASLWLDDNFVLTPVELRAKCRKLKRENGGLDLVVIDYLQLMHAPSDKANQSREQEIATISRSLKSLAKELQCPIVALSQLNRSVEKRKGEPPMLSDLRESGAIEQDADIVLFLHRSEEDSKEQQTGQANSDTVAVQLIIAKQRQGPTGAVDLVFFKTTTFFAEMEHRAAG
jgi:replicative DNA helicase